MKRNALKLSVGFLAAIVLLSACHSSSQVANQNSESKKITAWYAGRTWLDGLPLEPHASINQGELYRQYQLNPRYWDEAFHYLKTTDLSSLQPGTYVIDPGNVIATVSALSPKQRDDTNWEAHRNFNDLQYIISGRAGMGVASVDDPNATVKTPYDSRGDVTSFNVGGGSYYDAAPGTFFIFSPKDIHRPAFRVEGTDSIKKIVIKVRVPQS